MLIAFKLYIETGLAIKLKSILILYIAFILQLSTLHNIILYNYIQCVYCIVLFVYILNQKVIMAIFMLSTYNYNNTYVYVYLSMTLYVCVYMYVCMYACTYVGVYICTCTRIHVCIHIHIYTYIHAYTYICTLLDLSSSKK